MKNYVKGVSHDGTRLVFKVESESRSRMVHTVDLEAYKFNGQCDCEAFNFQCYPLLERGAHPSPHLQCKHVKKARDFLLNEMIHKLVGAMEQAAEDALPVSDPAEKPDLQPKRYYLKPRSDAMNKAMAEYSKIKGRWLKEHEFCEACRIRGVRGIHRATDVHHYRGRIGRLLCDTRYWKAVCRMCHDWIHENPDAARRMDLLAGVGEFNSVPEDSP